MDRPRVARKGLARLRRWRGNHRRPRAAVAIRGAPRTATDRRLEWPVDRDATLEDCSQRCFPVRSSARLPACPPTGQSCSRCPLKASRCPGSGWLIDGTPLAERNAVIRAPVGVSEWSRGRAYVTEPLGGLVIGDPGSGHSPSERLPWDIQRDVVSLPGSGHEAEQVAALLGRIPGARAPARRCRRHLRNRDARSPNRRLRRHPLRGATHGSMSASRIWPCTTDACGSRSSAPSCIADHRR